MDITYYGKTDKGKTRDKNEDYIASEWIDNQEYLFIVADGMGGHQAGEVASRLGTQTFIKSYKRCRREGLSVPEAMTVAIQEANSLIFIKSSGDFSKSGMGTTISVLGFLESMAHVVHVGDSRIYKISNEGGIKKITSDHTLVEKLLEDGQISEKEANEHPRKNILYMSVGVSKKIHPTVIKDIKVEEGDIFLLCTDGLSNMVSDRDILDVCLTNLPKDAVEKLIKKANHNGGLDNISVQVINIGQNEFLNKTQALEKNQSKSKNILLLYIGILFILIIIIITALQFI